MPNTLTHIAVNGFISKSIFKNSDLLWIYLGCVIPDFPWISMKVIELLSSNLNGYDVKAYAIVQASFLFCIILSASFALIGRNRVRVFLILILGSFLHLILDSMQIKWANGINLFAPFSWEMVSFNLFWPENNITYFLTISGILFFILNWKSITKISRPFKIDKNGLILSLLLIILYFTLPLLMIDSIYKNDLHYLSTLKDYEARVGKYVELDRKKIRFDKKSNSTWINAYDGQYIELGNIPEISARKLSIRGKFIEKELIEVAEYHENWALFRDGSSYIGIVLIGLVWVIVIKRGYF